MKYFITGGCGFIGSNLAKAVLDQGHELFILDNLSRQGGDKNLEWLKKQGMFKFFHQDIRHRDSVKAAIQQTKPDVIFHLSGQVAMTTSLNDPYQDFEINVVGGINVLEAVRCCSPQSTLIYSSTNKVYGDLEGIDYEETATRYLTKHPYEKGFSESLPLNFQSPYGCSKGAVDQYMLDYSRMFGLKTVVFRHSSVYGGHQYSTFDQGWVGWFMKQALLTQRDKSTSFSISGNGKQVRDLLYISDLVKCYFNAIDRIDEVKGHAFNLGGGIKNSLSLLELLQNLETILNVKLNYFHLPSRQSDQKVFIADITKAATLLEWKPAVDSLTGIKENLSWLTNHD